MVQFVCIEKERSEMTWTIERSMIHEEQLLL